MSYEDEDEGMDEGMDGAGAEAAAPTPGHTGAPAPAPGRAADPAPAPAPASGSDPARVSGPGADPDPDPGSGGPEAGEASEAGEAVAGAGLSVRELSVLAVERQGWSGPGAKERAVREQLGISPTRYYQLLNALLDDVRAEAHDPVTVHRLRRVRAERRKRQ
jgi:hypothetical protein